MKELRATAPGGAFIRSETSKQAKKVKLQCKHMEQNDTAPKIANRKITLVEATTDGEKACAKLYAMMMNWVALIYGETAARKFLVAQKEIHFATKAARQRGKVRETMLVPRPFVKFSKLAGTKIEVYVDFDFAALCAEAAGAVEKRDQDGLEAFLEREFDGTQGGDEKLPEIRATVLVFSEAELAEEIDKKRAEDGQRKPMWLAREEG